MFPKESFTGQDKKLAKSHSAEFSKYLDYQNQQGTIPRDQQHLPKIISMFKLTLQYIALGWFQTESPNWQTEDQIKQEFLQWFNPWGNTRRQQQDAWNKLKFDMTKDNVDAFVVDMKMLASILGHNDEMIMEKFKDIFPDPNIEAALIAMDDFTAMQTKAKQLVQIYKPADSTNIASAAILVYTPNDSPEKGKGSQNKSNQHQLAPISPPMNKIIGEVGKLAVDNEAEGAEMTAALEEGAALEALTIDMTIKIEGEVEVKEEESSQITEEEVKIIFLVADADNGIVTTLVTMTETIRIEIMMVTIMGTEVGDGMAIKGKVIMIEDGEDDGTQIPNTLNKTIHNTILTRIITGPLLCDANINTNCPMSNTRPTQNRNSNIHSDHLHKRGKRSIYVSCARIKATMTINANLQVISWPEHKKRLTKAITRTQIKGIGQMGTMIMKTPMASLFSKGGSQCR